MRRLEQVTEMPRTAWPSSVLRRFWEAQMAVVVAGSSARRTKRGGSTWPALPCGPGMAWRWMTGVWRRPGACYRDACSIRATRCVGPNGGSCGAALPAGWSRVSSKRWPSRSWRRYGPGGPHWQRSSGRRQARASKGSSAELRFGLNELAEVWQLLGSLELLDIGLKIELGQLVFDLGLRKGPEAIREASAWALGRLGTRVPVYGPLNTLVPVEVVEVWTQRLLALDADPAFIRRAGELPRSAVFVVVQLVVATGDRRRDIRTSYVMRYSSGWSKRRHQSILSTW